jgi:hypothetical protein
MQSTLIQSAKTNHSIDGSVDVFMHLWPAHNGDETGHDASSELELIASHTTSPNHVDPSCPACHRLRSQLQAIAHTVVRRLAPTMMDSITFDIYADFASIICSPSAGPCVTVSICIHDRNRNDSTLNGSATAVARIKEALKTFGVRER